MQELKFIVEDPAGSEFTFTLPNGETRELLKLGEFYIARLSEEDIPNETTTKDIIRSWGEQFPNKYLVVLMPGQELKKVELKTE